MNIAFHTLGCKVNQFETQALGLLLSERGHNITEDFSLADVIVVNSCTVTSTSDQKSRRIIRHLIKEYPNAKIAVCGCLSQVNPESIKEINGVSLICGTSGRSEFVDNIEKITTVNNNSFTPDNALKRRDFEILPAGGLQGHTRAMLKIEDGCSNFCSYCIIPYSRGPVRSLPPKKAYDECLQLMSKGYKEIIITGIEISSYGRDLTPKTDLTDLIAFLCKKFPDIRFRLGSLEPRTVTEDFCEKLKGLENLCPQFHLSLQSGSDATLIRMNRKYDTTRYFESVSLLKKHLPNCAVTTDLIVGFPGEDETEFSETLSFIEKCGFSSIHIFPYSQRKGTPAASMPNQLTRSEKAARVRRASKVSKSMEKSYLESQLFRELSVLFEEKTDNLWSGHSENYIRVYVESDNNLKNKVIKVSPSSLYRDGLFCKI